MLSLKTEGWSIFVSIYCKALKLCETGDFSKSYTFYHIFFMQISSRNFKKSSSTNGGSLNWKLLNLIAIRY